MEKILLISGSPRQGNTDLILNKVIEGLHGFDTEMILLRGSKVGHCNGCLQCKDVDKCPLDDDAQKINDKLLEADVIVIGTPNYFDSVPGLVKDFIDRTNPFYHTDKLKGKKVLNIVVGGGKKENSQKVIDGPLSFFAAAHGLENIGNYIFQGLHIGDVEQDEDFEENIRKIIKTIRNI